MQSYSCSPVSMITGLWRNRSLVSVLVKREVIGRYRGSVMGILWSFFTPLLMLGIYTFVFGFIFKAKWNPSSESRGEFALMLFAGLIVFNLFSECVSRSPQLVTANPSYVKKVIFPIEILPIVAFGSALFHACVSLLVWYIAYFILIGVPPVGSLLAPVVFLPVAAVTLGLTWALASLGVYIRDISQIIGMFVSIVLFLSPIFYPISSLPEEYRAYLYLNPMTPSVELMRSILFWEHIPDFLMYTKFLIGSFLFAWCGFVLFQKTRKGFADVL